MTGRQSDARPMRAIYRPQPFLNQNDQKDKKPAAEKLSVFLSGKKGSFPERKAEHEEHERGERALCGAA